jgi:hypothetical protein
MFWKCNKCRATHVLKPSVCMQKIVEFSEEKFYDAVRDFMTENETRANLPSREEVLRKIQQDEEEIRRGEGGIFNEDFIQQKQVYIVTNCNSEEFTQIFSPQKTH